MTDPTFTVPGRHRDDDARVDDEGVLHLGTSAPVAEQAIVRLRTERASS